MNRKQRRAAATANPAAAAATAPFAAAPFAAAPFTAALAALRAGNLAKAESLYRRALAIDPGHADTLNLLGALRTQAGAHEEARTLLTRAATLAPGNPAIHYNLAAAHQAAGDPESALAAYRRTTDLHPGHQAAWNNLALILQQLGRRLDAATAFRRALALGADPRIHVNLAALHRQGGDPARAAHHHRQALALDPHHAEARIGLADALLASGDPAGALAEACRAVSASDTPAARTAFAAAVAAAPDVPPGAAALLRRALDESWARARDLARPAARAVWARLAQAPTLDRLAADPLLTALLRAAPVPHEHLEAALTRARSTLLATAEAATPGAATPGAASPEAATDDDRLPFWCALAEQCVLNEYVFDVTDDETQRAAALHGRLATDAAAGRPVPPLLPVAVASYAPLDIPGLTAVPWPAPVRDLLTRVIEHPRLERELAATIPRLTPLADATSRAVGAQYEENPYPRWTGTPPATPPVPLATYLARTLPNPAPPPPGRDVLIAGCGTGQQSLEVAAALSDARVLAIDLSRASLAYARRKSTALPHLAYAQADLLRLPDTGHTFDLIQASGVLHHLADPGEGWRALLAVLRPGGLMFLGLYSACARADVVAARALVADHALPPTPAGIRACRRLLRDAPAGSPLQRLVAASDFASLSGCRDLLFHVQEHRLTLPWIADFIHAHGLEFLGFDLPAPARAAYHARVPEDPTGTDLASWHTFEQSAPTTFAAMYQFWIRKPR